MEGFWFMEGIALPNDSLDAMLLVLPYPCPGILAAIVYSVGVLLEFELLFLALIWEGDAYSIDCDFNEEALAEE